jgi:hypothetical protein
MIEVVEQLAAIPPYDLAQSQKMPMLLEALNALSRHHARQCDAYRRIMKALAIEPGTARNLAEVPILAVPLFKRYALRSSDEIVKVLTSSGTSGQAPSRIYLDRETAALQTRTLVKIVRDFLGAERLPMLIVDTPSILRRRDAFSARAAGILGFANFGREHTYLLDDEMVLEREKLEAFLAKHGKGPVLVFGFTFMVWKYFYEPLAEEGIDLSNAVLIHGGGWKKLAEEAVAPERFRAALKEAFGLTRIHDYYGMVEQVGTIFMGCEAGHLHAPAYADIVVRDRQTLAPLPIGKRGLVSLFSIVPQSYPGHALLSEDIGEWVGEDDCPCGRKGRYFRIHGRLESAERRGCSDTFEVRV